MADTLPLPAQLSAAFVAMAVEIDDTAERDIPHRTTAFGDTGGPGSLWLTSIAVWFNAIRVLVEVDHLTVAQVRDRTGLDTNVDGLRRWGYVTVDGVGRRLDGRKRPVPRPNSALALTRPGRDAAAVWEPLPAAIELRWRIRFGSDAIDRAREALLVLVRQADGGMPDYLPILHHDMWTRLDRAAPFRAPPHSEVDPDDLQLPLICLLARALLALTLDFERDAAVALPVWSDGLRLLATEPTPLRMLPARAGVGIEAMTMVLTHLRRAGLVDITSTPGERGQQARLTPLGEQERRAGTRRYAAIAKSPALDHISVALQPLVGDGTRQGSPLFAGLEPGPANWRANIPRPDCWPWYPLVLHRGGYPDGS